MATQPVKTYAQILSQIDSLKKQADDLRDKEVKGVVTKIKEAIAVYGITASDLGFKDAQVRATRTLTKGPRSPKRTAKSSAARYGDGNGNSWVGRGKRPRWITAALAAGKQLSDFELGKS
jgi:DNA-binding protein H-NS